MPSAPVSNWEAGAALDGEGSPAGVSVLHVLVAEVVAERADGIAQDVRPFGHRDRNVEDDAYGPGLRSTRCIRVKSMRCTSMFWRRLASAHAYGGPGIRFIARLWQGGRCLVLGEDGRASLPGGAPAGPVMGRGLWRGYDVRGGNEVECRQVLIIKPERDFVG